MMVQRRKQFKLIAFLLQYPDKALVRCLPDISEAIAKIDDPQARETLRCFSDGLENTPLIDLQERYTAAFDMAPATCLNLTYHLLGDDAERGRVLSTLQQAYRQAGYAAATPELPDYLPMVLEFLAIQPDTPNAEPLWPLLDAVPAIAQGLDAAGSFYAPLMAHLAKITPHPADPRPLGCSPKDDANPESQLRSLS